MIAFFLALVYFSSFPLLLLEPNASIRWSGWVNGWMPDDGRSSNKNVNLQVVDDRLEIYAVIVRRSLLLAWFGATSSHSFEYPS